MGGVINIITKKNTAQWTGSIKLDTTLQENSKSGHLYQTNAYIAGPLIANQWYHTAMVVQANSASSHYVFGYVNGQLVITSNDTTTYSTSSGVSMGTYNGVGGGPLNGYLRNVKYWSRALSGTEIQDEFNSTVPVHKAGLLAYYPFDTSLAADLSGNGNILTSNGTVTLVDGNYSKSWLGRGMNYIR